MAASNPVSDAPQEKVPGLVEAPSGGKFFIKLATEEPLKYTMLLRVPGETEYSHSIDAVDDNTITNAAYTLLSARRLALRVALIADSEEVELVSN